MQTATHTTKTATDTLSLASKDSTTVALTGDRVVIESRVRGGGIGRRAYAAIITAPHAKYHLDREFLDADRSGLSGSGRSGIITWEAEVQTGTIIEMAKYAEGSNVEGEPAYILVTAEGLVRISKAEAIEHMNTPAPTTTPDAAATAEEHTAMEQHTDTQTDTDTIDMTEHAADATAGRAAFYALWTDDGDVLLARSALAPHPERKGVMEETGDIDQWTAATVEHPVEAAFEDADGDVDHAAHQAALDAARQEVIDRLAGLGWEAACTVEDGSDVVVEAYALAWAGEGAYARSAGSVRMEHGVTWMADGSLR